MGNYDDIINLPHHVSNTHPHMSMKSRGAQFAAFAALSGYGEAVDETAENHTVETEFERENETGGL